MEPLPRRRFLELTWVSAGAVLAPLSCGSETNGALRTLRTDEAFPQSLASGDPRPDSVVLWTRVVDPERPDDDLDLSLELSEDDSFSSPISLDGRQSRTVRALTEFDHCVKTLVTGLKPGTTYFYRFKYESRDVRASTRVARTKTAPATDADVSVRFAVVSCQDFAGKYFHAHRHLATLEVDVVVHLGDYIYETTADPSFQVLSATRSVTFGKPDQAQSFENGGAPFQAARSLDNYRDLYRLYRADPDLQALHERFPFIVIQDDHEFSDDCHGAVATYTDGREDETDLPRRLAADQAWFEYMPVDLSQAPGSDWDAGRSFPEELSYYRNFAFGLHLELVMTDLRRYRPDHLVPEDAFPGAVFLDEPSLTALSGTLPEDAAPYVDIDRYEGGTYQAALQAGASQLGFQSSSLTGTLSVPFINDCLTQLGLSAPAPIDPDQEGLGRGYAYHQLLKTEEFSRIGSRYVVAQNPFNALALARFRATNGKSEQLMGQAQRAWFLKTMKESTRTFKVWGSEVCLMPRHIDLTHVSLAPPGLRQKIAISAEDWDGFPNEREALLAELAPLGNVVIVSGDLHCFFAGTPYANDDPEQRVVEFVTGSLTSTTWQNGINALVTNDPKLPPETKFIAAAVGTLLVDRTTRPNPHLAWQNLVDNGYGVFEVSRERMTARLLTVPAAVVATAPEQLPAELEALFTEQTFEIPAGSSDLFRTSPNGDRQRWDIATVSWVAAI